MGGRGNECGGVIANSRYLVGEGFAQFEGARVVTSLGHATIEDGAFRVYQGTYAGCGARSALYRIDVSPNGRCDDDDRVFLAQGDGLLLQVTADQPGATASCGDSDGDGYDLELTLLPECLANCGVLRVVLNDEQGTPFADADTVFLDTGPSDEHGLAEAVVPGRSYRLDYAWSCNFGSFTGCTGTTEHAWSHEFTAVEGVNRVELSLR